MTSIENMKSTPIYRVSGFHNVYIKREDFIPFSFGGNKARKARLFFGEIDNGPYDCVVTYGSSSSNHCRIVANACCQRKMPCFIVSPTEASEETFNSKMMTLFGAERIIVPVQSVHETIEKKLAELLADGRKPYFIPGGGHGNIGTKAYVQCYEEIREQEKELGVFFDYIFLPSGTGTTQAGLICGQLLYGDIRQIIGISIARKNPKGRDVVLQSVRDYLCGAVCEKKLQESTILLDQYSSGYGKHDARVQKMIEMVLKDCGIPLDETYTGKAFWGMTDFLGDVRNKNILFIHTGGTPLFFDSLRYYK